MRAPRIAPDNRIKGQQRRASAEITAGIENEIERLHQLNPRKRLGEFLAFFAIYAIGALVTHRSTGHGWIVGVLLMGIAMNSLGILLHEGLHGVLAADPRRNHLLSFLVGLPILLSASAYQATHNDHHYDLGRKLDYGTYRQHLHKPGLVWSAYLLQLFLGSVIYVLLIPVLGYRAAAREVRPIICIELAIIVTALVLAILYVPAPILLLYWLGPLIVTNVLSNIRGLASHALGDPEDIYLSSRTVTCSTPMEWLFLHENYHLEHHLFPRVPSYHLAELHRLIWPRLPRALAAPSYPRFLADFFGAALRRDLRPVGVETRQGVSAS